MLMMSHGVTYVVALAQSAHDLLDLRQRLGLVRLLLGLLALSFVTRRRKGQACELECWRGAREPGRTAFPMPILNCMFSPTVVVELLGPGGLFFSAPNLTPDGMLNVECVEAREKR